MAALFSVEEANRLIPEIASRIEVVRARRRQLEELRARLGGVAERSQGNGHANGHDLGRREAAAKAALDEMNEALTAIQALGCVVKDLDQGLVDFPHERDGRVVFLCWRAGESVIAWWHEVEAGFGGRQPL